MRLIHTWETEKYRYRAFVTTRDNERPNAGNVGLHVDDDPELVVSNREHFFQKVDLKLSDSVWAEQVHGTAIQEVNRADRGKGAFRYDEAIPATDGLVTDCEDVSLALVFADCVPLFFCAKDHGVIGIAHAGWKGTVGNIVSVMLESFKSKGIERDEVDMFVGPAIAFEDYEVDKRVLDAIEAVSPTAYEQSVFNESNGRALVSLQTVNEVLAKGHHTNVSQSNLTTGADAPFFSYREGEAKRRFAAVLVKEKKS